MHLFAHLSRVTHISRHYIRPLSFAAHSTVAHLNSTATSSPLLQVSSAYNSSSSLCYRNMSTVSSGADRIKHEKESVWVEFIQLALDEKPLNLGQGFPDFAAPSHVVQALSDATLSKSNVLLNQYTRGYGHPRLVNALSTLYSQLIGRQIDAKSEILVTVGAYEALLCAILGHVNPGEEVIIIEPFFDCYEPMTKMAGGVPVYVPLRKNSSGNSSRNWVLDMTELESKFTDKTRMIIINTPHNPIGKVFTEQELIAIGNLCEKYNTIILMDEVYEWLIFSGHQHVRMASLGDFWKRTITVGSAGKTFSVTGWKLGWAYGPKELLKPMQLIHQNTVYTCSTVLQEAVAVSFETEIARLGTNDSYWKQLAQSLEGKRDKMAKFLTDVGMNPTVPEGGYFMVADYTSLTANKINFSNESGQTKDHKFVRWLSKNKKLQGIPPSAFYCEKDKQLGEDYIRFCFIKEDETLDKAERILLELKSSLSKL